MLNNTKQYQIVKSGNFVVILYNFPAKSIYFDLAFRVGSRYEDEQNNGLSHLIEHLYGEAIVDSFKSHPWIRHYIDDTFHAYTKEDRTNFEFIIHQKDCEEAIKVISQVARGFKTDKRAIDFEKEIISEEILDHKASDYFWYHKIFRDFYYNNPLKFEVLGTDKNIKNFNIKEVSEFAKRYYNLDNAVLTIAGDFNCEKVEKFIRKEFHYLQATPKVPLKTPKNVKYFTYLGDRLHIKSKKNTPRTFLGYYHPVFNVSAVENVEWEFFREILNNFLFYKITSKLPIYSVDTNTRTFHEFINFSIEASFGHKKTESFYTLLLKELRRFRKSLTLKEFSYFKERKITSLDLDKDDIRESANMLSWYAIMFGVDNILTLSDQQKIIESMNIKKIYYYFDLLFKNNKGTVVVLGKISEKIKQKLEKLWRRGVV